MKLNWALSKSLKIILFQYVSILRLIEVLLSKEDVQKYVLSSGKTENDGLICELKDGQIYKNNP